LVLAENARQALQFATSGNVDAAITSWSLVARQQGVAVPESLHAPIEQACGIVASTRQLDAARAYLDFLKGPEGAKILERHGLRPVTGKTK
ncbi:MAG: substrate-binding domain-containing protein, partial [Gemmataceae bacterium]